MVSKLFLKKQNVFVLIIFTLIIFSINPLFGLTPEDIIEDEVLEAVQQNGEVRVMINLKANEQEGKSIASEQSKDEINDILNQKINEFDDKISAVVSADELEELKNSGEVESIKIVGTRSLTLQDSVGIINATETHAIQVNGINLTGQDETICIIDTGANYNHTSLGGGKGAGYKVLDGWDFCADDVICNTADSVPDDQHGHGSHVAGIAAASGGITGVAPGANLVILKAANSSGTFWDDDLENAIDWCVNNASLYNISVISMSLGGGLYSSYCNDDPLNDSINNAVLNNISVIVASGNDGSTSQIAAPACHVNVTPVGGTDDNDAMYSNGNRNSLIQLLAPGVSINSTYKTSNTYATSSGTSMSTPHVAGAFALINQYRRLEGSIDMLPLDIEDVLNNSGKIIYDSGSGLNFSRIKIYSTLLTIDIGAPNVSLVSPVNDAVNISTNQTFKCNVTDPLQLSNLTFNLWNSSSDLINETTISATENNLEVDFNITDLSNGTYYWNCLGYDDKVNNAYAVSNYSLIVGNISIELVAPDNQEHTNVNATNFTCNMTDSASNLTNVTFYLWNSTSDLVYNETATISGNVNETTFDYNLTTEEAYTWNCEVHDADSNSIQGSTNFTITHDQTGPIVTLEGPADEASTTDTTPTFEYSVSDNIEVKNCSLFVDDVIKSTDTSITMSTTQELSTTLSTGTYDWKVRCYDNAGNSGESAIHELTITSSGSSSSSGGGGGGGGSVVTGLIFNATDEDIKEGYTNFVNDEYKINFNVGNESHTLVADDVTNIDIKITISSDPITITIKLGESEKVDVNLDKIYDLQITYDEYINNLAKITIKAIEEPIGTREIVDESNETITEEPEITYPDISELFSKLSTRTWIIVGIVAAIIVLAVISFYVYNKSHKRSLGKIFKKKYKHLFK